MSGLFDRKEVFVSGGEAALTAEEIEKLFPPPDYFIARLDGSSARNKAELLAALAAALRFPAYFGHNWDALLDCLRSLPEFAAARGYAVLVERSEAMLKDSPEELEAFREIVGTAAEFLLEKYKLPLKVVTL